MGKFNLKWEEVRFELVEGNLSLAFEFNRLTKGKYISKLLEFLSINEENVTGSFAFRIFAHLKVENNTQIFTPGDLTVEIKDGIILFQSARFKGIVPNIAVSDFIQFFVDLGYPDPRNEIQWTPTEISLDNLAEKIGETRKPSWREFWYPRDGIEERHFIKGCTVLYFDTGEDQCYHFNEEQSFNFSPKKVPLSKKHSEIIEEIRKAINFEIWE